MSIKTNSPINQEQLKLITTNLAINGQTKLALRLIWMNYRIQALNSARQRHNLKVAKLTVESKALMDEINMHYFKSLIDLL